jgi:hypothetical protein
MPSDKISLDVETVETNFFQLIDINNVYRHKKFHRPPDRRELVIIYLKFKFSHIYLHREEVSGRGTRSS